MFHIKSIDKIKSDINKLNYLDIFYSPNKVNIYFLRSQFTITYHNKK